MSGQRIDPAEYILAALDTKKIQDRCDRYEKVLREIAERPHRNACRWTRADETENGWICGCESEVARRALRETE